MCKIYVNYVFFPHMIFCHLWKYQKKESPFAPPSRALFNFIFFPRYLWRFYASRRVHKGMTHWLDIQNMLFKNSKMNLQRICLSLCCENFPDFFHPVSFYALQSFSCYVNWHKQKATYNKILFYSIFMVILIFEICNLNKICQIQKEVLIGFHIINGISKFLLNATMGLI